MFKENSITVRDPDFQRIFAPWFHSLAHWFKNWHKLWLSYRWTTDLRCSNYIDDFSVRLPSNLTSEKCLIHDGPIKGLEKYHDSRNKPRSQSFEICYMVCLYLSNLGTDRLAKRSTKCVQSQYTVSSIEVFLERQLEAEEVMTERTKWSSTLSWLVLEGMRN